MKCKFNKHLSLKNIRCWSIVGPFISMGLLTSCTEQTPTSSVNPEYSVAYVQNLTNTSGVSNRAVGSTGSIDINEVFGAGYLASNKTTISTNASGVVGNAGGFGFNGSIGSIIGNIGGFGFGGFGTFASFFAGSLPSSPPAGILIPPGVGSPPGTGGFGPPPGSFAPPIGGFVPPVGSVPPAVGGVGGGAGAGGVGGGAGAGGVGGGAGAGGVGGGAVAGGVSGGAGAGGVGAASNIITIFTNTNLTELQTPLTNVDIDVLLVSPVSRNAFGARAVTLALTETVVPCLGGGTMTQIVDDVDPAGLSSGDSRTTVYTECAKDAAGVNIVSGSRGFVTDEVFGVAFVTPTWISRSTMFRNNFTKTNTAAGTSRMTDGSTTTGIMVTENNFVNQQAVGSGTSSRVGPNNSSASNYDFDLQFSWDVVAQQYSISFNVNVENVSTQSMGSNVITVLPIGGVLGQAPTTGQIVFNRLVDNVVISVIVATAQADGMVLVEVDNNADTIIDSSTIEVDWSGVLFTIFNG